MIITVLHAKHTLVKFAAVSNAPLGEAHSILPLGAAGNVHTALQLHLTSYQRQTLSQLTDLQARFVLLFQLTKAHEGSAKRTVSLNGNSPLAASGRSKRPQTKPCQYQS